MYSNYSEMDRENNQKVDTWFYVEMVETEGNYHYTAVLANQLHNLFKGTHNMNYCEHCKQAFQGPHKCANRCNICNSPEIHIGPRHQNGHRVSDVVDWQKCELCNCTFAGIACYNHHMKTGDCGKYWKCNIEGGCGRKFSSVGEKKLSPAEHHHAKPCPHPSSK